jgi:hypothetical protein
MTERDLIEPHFGGYAGVNILHMTWKTLNILYFGRFLKLFHQVWRLLCVYQIIFEVHFDPWLVGTYRPAQPLGGGNFKGQLPRTDCPGVNKAQIN